MDVTRDISHILPASQIHISQWNCALWTCFRRKNLWKCVGVIGVYVHPVHIYWFKPYTWWNIVLVFFSNFLYFYEHGGIFNENLWLNITHRREGYILHHSSKAVSQAHRRRYQLTHVSLTATCFIQWFPIQPRYQGQKQQIWSCGMIKWKRVRHWTAVQYSTRCILHLLLSHITCNENKIKGPSWVVKHNAYMWTQYFMFGRRWRRCQVTSSTGSVFYVVEQGLRQWLCNVSSHWLMLRSVIAKKRSHVPNCELGHHMLHVRIVNFMWIRECYEVQVTEWTWVDESGLGTW